MTSLPDNLRPYRSTPAFDTRSVPTALTARHSTKSGVWGCIQVTAGSLRLTRFHEPGGGAACEIVETGAMAVVAPKEPHFVTLDEDTEFRVTFYRERRATEATPER